MHNILVRKRSDISVTCKSNTPTTISQWNLPPSFQTWPRQGTKQEVLPNHCQLSQ